MRFFSCTFLQLASCGPCAGRSYCCYTLFWRGQRLPRPSPRQQLKRLAKSGVSSKRLAASLSRRRQHWRCRRGKDQARARQRARRRTNWAASAPAASNLTCKDNQPAPLPAHQLGIGAFFSPAGKVQRKMPQRGQTALWSPRGSTGRRQRQASPRAAGTGEGGGAAKHVSPT